MGYGKSANVYLTVTYSTVRLDVFIGISYNIICGSKKSHILRAWRGSRVAKGSRL